MKRTVTLDRSPPGRGSSFGLAHKIENGEEVVGTTFLSATATAEDIGQIYNEGVLHIAPIMKWLRANPTQSTVSRRRLRRSVRTSESAGCPRDHRRDHPTDFIALL